jgi:hypothetical protein
LQVAVFVAAMLCVAHAGAPAAYSTYTATGDYGSIGSTHESTVKGFGGNSVVSQYSKAVDTPHSSVRKSDIRVSNDAFAYAPAAYHAAAPAYAAYAAPAYARAAYAAPAYSAYAAPAYARAAYAAPVLAKTAVAAPLGVHYSAAPAVAHISFDGLGAHYAW